MTDHPRSPASPTPPPRYGRDTSLARVGSARRPLPSPSRRERPARRADPPSLPDQGVVDGGLYVAPWPPEPGATQWTPIGETVDPLTIGQTPYVEDLPTHPPYGPDHHALGLPCPTCEEQAATS